MMAARPSLTAAHQQYFTYMAARICMGPHMRCLHGPMQHEVEWHNRPNIGDARALIVAANERSSPLIEL